ncbi:ADP-ribosylation family protein [Actinomadura algeriensis]|uniref:DUF2228 domain-containing protein n=1 Tax=Actinomadura algeriensis TaxID=1679523 RepID=A0ABR9JQ98_9ACTN|nr:ADP-ribosylation family protein [Actinomadura algeriensis]MBE1532737.1 hypothetical protein [Actinomadura algeriensis]
MNPTDRAAVEDRFERDWGVTLPESIFRFWEFCASPAASSLAELDIVPAGVSHLSADPGAAPRDGIDVRVHGRFYCDPPEFMTFMFSGSDGYHHGLWSDDGRTCGGVASYYTHDGGGIERSAATPLEAVRAVLERHQRDLEDDDPGHSGVVARLSRLAALRDALTGVETGDRPETGYAYSRKYDPSFLPPRVDPARVTTLDGAGALVDGATALGRPPHNRADMSQFAGYVHATFEDAAALEAQVEEALRRCAAGDPAEALVLGRDLHWASGGDPVREAHANRLLTAAYRALDRPALAGIADAHHRHRALSSVHVLA